MLCIGAGSVYRQSFITLVLRSNVVSVPRISRRVSSWKRGKIAHAVGLQPVNPSSQEAIRRKEKSLFIAYSIVMTTE